MIAFRDPVLEDRAWVEQGFRASGSRGCEYSFATLFLWSRRYRQQVAALDGYVLERLQGDRGAGYLFRRGRAPWSPPCPRWRPTRRSGGSPFRLFCVTPEQLERLEAVRPGVYSWQADRDGFDYLYDAGRLAGLSGKKLHGKRNHINAFLADHTDWRVEEITEDNLGACVAMDAAWNRLYCSGRGVDASEAGQDPGRGAGHGPGLCQLPGLGPVRPAAAGGGGGGGLYHGFSHSGGHPGRPL